MADAVNGEGEPDGKVCQTFGCSSEFLNLMFGSIFVSPHQEMREERRRNSVGQRWTINNAVIFAHIVTFKIQSFNKHQSQFFSKSLLDFFLICLLYP